VIRTRALKLFLMFGTLMLFVCSCGPKPSGTDSDEETPPPSAIVMAVTGAKVARRPMQSRVRLLGTTVARRHLMLRAPAAGRIVGLGLQSGDKVSRGQIVARIINREAEAAENGLAVARGLDPNEAASLASALKRHSSNTAIAVTVPEDLVVAQRIVSDGQIVAELDPIADLTDPRSIYVEAAVPVDQLAKLHSGANAIVTSPLNPGIQYAARVGAESPNFSAGGATLPIRIEFTGIDRLTQSGAPVEVEIVTADLPDAIVVPNAALFEEASTGAHHVFVAGDDGLAHRTEVKLGLRNDKQTQITSGLQPGTIVITSGGYALADGLRVKVTLANP